MMMIRAAVRVCDPGWLNSMPGTHSSRRVFIMIWRGDDKEEDNNDDDDNNDDHNDDEEAKVNR